MRTLIQIVTIMLVAISLLLVPSIILAEDTSGQEGTAQSGYATTQGTTGSTKKTETPPPPKTYVVHYDPNGGEGDMPSTTFTEGGDMKLDRCTFIREGYTFEGWDTSPEGDGTRLADGADASAVMSDGLTLYAQWGSQIYLLRYSSGVPEKSDSPATGTMQSQLVVHDAEVMLKDCEFSRKGYTPKCWVDQSGVQHAFGETGVNFSEQTDTTSWELATIEANPPEQGYEGKWTCQGSVVFKGDDGSLCAAMAFFYTSDEYSHGNLDAYDSVVKVVNLDTGQELKSANGLMIEHGNDIAYRPDNGHFYIAQGGLHEGTPDGIVELDENLHEVRTVTPEGTNHIWNLSYSNGRFYGIANVSGTSFAGGNPEGETSDLIVLDKDLNLLETYTVDYSLQGFSGQGMVCDGSFLYSILVNFGEHEAATKQRLAIFSLDGESRGSMRIDINAEVESASTVDGRMYFSINGGERGVIYGTDLPSSTMSVVWEPNPYTIEFDANGEATTAAPSVIQTTYDESVALPSQVPQRAGYEFAGWNTQADGKGTSYQPGDTVHNLAESGSARLYAQWKRPLIGLVADNGSKTEQSNEEEKPAGLLSSRSPRHFAKAVAVAAALLPLIVLRGDKRRATSAEAICA